MLIMLFACLLVCVCVHVCVCVCVCVCKTYNSTIYSLGAVGYEFIQKWRHSWTYNLFTLCSTTVVVIEQL